MKLTANNTISCFVAVRVAVEFPDAALPSYQMRTRIR